MGRVPTSISSSPRTVPAYGLNAAEAAAYVGVGETYFRALVVEGKMPRPRVFGQRRLWSIDELTASFKAMPIDGEAPSDTWADWERA